LRIFYWIIMLVILTSLLWLLDYVFDDSDTTCTTLWLSLDIVTINTIPWSWYTLYSLSDFVILVSDLWSCFIESHCLALALINKNQSSRGYWWRLVVEDQRGVLGRATPQLTFIIKCYMIPEYSELYLHAIRIHKRITWLICSCPVGWGTRWLR